MWVAAFASEKLSETAVPAFVSIARQVGKYSKPLQEKLLSAAVAATAAHSIYRRVKCMRKLKIENGVERLPLTSLCIAVKAAFKFQHCALVLFLIKVLIRLKHETLQVPLLFRHLSITHYN